MAAETAQPGRDWAQPPRIDQELWEGYPAAPQVTHGIASDGMPHPSIPYSLKQAQAPDLLPETFVCMADTSVFVRRGQWGEIVARFEPDSVERAPDGRYRVAMKSLLFGVSYVEVEPLRPVCKHYARQLTDVQDDPDFRFVARLCTLRRAEDGEYLSLRDSQVLACELRSPPDPESAAQLDTSDAERVARARAKQDQSAVFDVDAALAAEDEQP